MRVCYQIQTHRAPAQVGRLVRALLETSRDPIVVVDHDRNGSPLDETAWAKDARVLVRRSDGGYASWTHVQRYLDVCEMLDDRGVDYDWMVNISGQDYPVRPLAEAEDELASSGADGFLEHFAVLGPASPWPRQRARTRYWYHYRRLARLSEGTSRRLRPLHAFNRVQPLLRVNTSTSFAAGWRARTPFGPDYGCYGGSFFASLSRPCVELLRGSLQESPEVARHFRQVLAPEEAYFQTVLVNAGRFRLENDCKRYFDFTASRRNHPRTLDVHDVDLARARGAHFARKWEMERDPDAFEAMDRHVYAATPRQPAGAPLPVIALRQDWIEGASESS